MPDDIDRLYLKLDKLFDLVGEQQKALASVESALKSHLDASEIRVAGYDSFIEDVKNKEEYTHKSLDKIAKFITTYEAEKKSKQNMKAFIQWFLGVVTTILGILAYLGFKK